MAVAVNVAGLAPVYVDLGSGLQLLGYTANGVDIATSGYFLDVPGDQNGGDNGPPIEIQYFGETAEIRLDLTKYDPAIAEAIEARLARGTPGQPAPAGSIIFGSGSSMRLAIACASRPRNFPRAVPRGACQVNKGTRYSRFIVDFVAYKSISGVLWNTSVS